MEETRRPLRAFISYARQDAAEFAEELARGLEVAGFEASLDRHSIAGGDDWERRLGELIEAADTMVFVLTPASAASPRCKWELERAVSLSKRVLPVVLLDTPEADTPESVRRLNYIFFTQGRSYSASLGELAGALRTDLGWIREHTRLGELARRWEERQRGEALLLRGPELDTARAWRDGKPADAPTITDLQTAFIAASEAAEGALVRRERARRRRLIWGLAGATAVFAILGSAAAVFGFMADANSRLAQGALARSLVERTWEIRDDGELALKYALAGYQANRDSPLVRSALAFALERGQSAIVIPSGAAAPVQVSALSPDGGTVAMIGDDGGLAFVDIAGRAATPPVQVGQALAAGFSPDGSLVFVMQSDGAGVVFNRRSRAMTDLGDVGRVTRAAFSPDGRRLALYGFDPAARLWDMESGRTVAVLNHRSYVTSARFSADGTRLLTASGDNTARIWDAHTGALLANFMTSSFVIDAAFSPDARMVATSTGVEYNAVSEGGVAVANGADAITLWDAATGRVVRRLRHSEDVRKLAFSPDGARLFGLDEAGRFVQWDLTSGRPLKAFDGRRFGVLDGVFAADGSIFVGQSETFAAVLWESATNRVIGLLPEQNRSPGRVLGVHGNVAVLALQDGSVVAWDFRRALQAPERLAADGCAALRARGQMQFSELELAADPLIADAWSRQGPVTRPVCPDQ